VLYRTFAYGVAMIGCVQTLGRIASDIAQLCDTLHACAFGKEPFGFLLIVTHALGSAASVAANTGEK
jgi:hypothetical protein